MGGGSRNEISDMVGFSETEYSRSIFKKYYKMSPSRYAKGGGNPTAIDLEVTTKMNK